MLNKKQNIFVLFMLFNSFLLSAFTIKNITQSQSSKSFLKNISSSFQEIKSSITAKYKSFQENMNEAFDSKNMPTNIFLLFFLAFLAGLSVSLTPCIYPLIPITVGILTSRRQLGYLPMFSRLFSYLLGLLIVFSSLGIIATKFNIIFGSWLSSPIIILIISCLFIFLALSLLDVVNFDFTFSLQTPEVSSNFTAFLFGATSAFVASPCMTPALVSLLGFISQQNNIVLSALLLFFFGLGMTTLILLISVIGSSFAFLPKPGAWMNEFRKILGFWVLFMTISFIKPVLKQNWIEIFLQGFLAIIIAFYYFFSNKTETVSKIIKDHSTQEYKENSLQPETSNFFIWRYLSFTYFIKMIVSIAALCFGLNLVLKSYLLYRQITLIKLIKITLF